MMEGHKAEKHLITVARCSMEMHDFSDEIALPTQNTPNKMGAFWWKPFLSIID